MYGQNIGPVLLSDLSNRQRRFDLADFEFEIPISPLACTSGQIDTGLNVGPGEVGQCCSRASSLFAFREIAAIDQEIRLLGERFFNDRQLAGIPIRHGFLGEVTGPELQLSRIPM